MGSFKASVKEPFKSQIQSNNFDVYVKRLSNRVEDWIQWVLTQFRETDMVGIWW